MTSEYRSKVSFLGLPVVHIAMGSMVQGRYRRGVATGWIAIGDVAVGVLLGAGGVSLGAISLGGLALGLVPVGGLAVGLLALGGLAVGVVVLGGAAIGWYAALGGLAIAGEYAIGGIAHARHVITPTSAGSLPISSIPHPSFRWTDALVLIAIVMVLVRVSLSVRSRRAESEARE